MSTAPTRGPLHLRATVTFDGQTSAGLTVDDEVIHVSGSFGQLFLTTESISRVVLEPDGTIVMEVGALRMAISLDSPGGRDELLGIVRLAHLAMPQ